MARKGSSMFKATFLVTAVIIASKVAGFARDMIMANYFGTGMENDAYVASYSLFYLPVMLFTSCVTSTLIPLYIKAKEERGPGGANRFANNSLNMFLLGSLVISALMYVLAEPLVHLVYGSLDAETVALTVRLTRIMVLSLAFNVAAIVLSSLYNAVERYVSAQLMGFPISFAVIIASIFFSGRYGIEAVAWGIYISGILQVLILLPGLRGWFRYQPVADIRDRRFRQLLMMAGPAVLSMAVSELSHMIDNAMASGLNTGAISALSYAFRLITFITGVLIVPLTTVVFSKMSQLVARKNRDGILRMIRQCVELLSLVVLPIVTIAAVMAGDVITFAYRSGQFAGESVAITAGVFLFFVIGVPFFGLRDLLNRTFHAMQNTRVPFVISCVVMVLKVILNLLLRGPMGVNGLALATSISSAIGIALMFYLLKRELGRTGLMRTLPELVKVAAATVLCGITCALVSRLMPASTGRLDAFIRLAIATSASGAVYLIACLALRVRLIGTAADIIFSRKK